MKLLIASVATLAFAAPSFAQEVPPTSNETMVHPSGPITTTTSIVRKPVRHHRRHKVRHHRHVTKAHVKASMSTTHR